MKSYTKNHLSIIHRVAQASIATKRKVIPTAQKADSLAHAK
jgi:hypothetical protein